MNGSFNRVIRSSNQLRETELETDLNKIYLP